VFAIAFVACMKQFPVKDGYLSVADLGCGYKIRWLESQKPIFYSKQWHHNGSKNDICL